ncbi:hypothetical protein CO613_11350, partial [Lysobacteraceae bacterium NML07-0707]
YDNLRDQIDSPFRRQYGITIWMFIWGLLKQVVWLWNLHLALPTTARRWAVYLRLLPQIALGRSPPVAQLSSADHALSWQVGVDFDGQSFMYAFVQYIEGMEVLTAIQRVRHEIHRSQGIRLHWYFQRLLLPHQGHFRILSSQQAESFFDGKAPAHVSSG